MRKRQRRHTARCAFLALTLFFGAVRPEAADRSFAFKVTGRQTSIYLVGSVHLLSKDFYPLNAALETAFKDSDLLVEELDMGEMMEPTSQMRMLTRGMLPAGQSLDNVISPATFEKVRDRADALRLPITPLKRFKPWSLSMMLTTLTLNTAGFDENLGLDKHFYDRAIAEGRLVQGLETTEFQISMLDEMTPAQQDRFLAETLKDMEDLPTAIGQLTNAWKTGDEAALAALALQDMKADPEVYERMLAGRNRKWMPKIEALFNRRGRALVVVGAAHLVGPDGLLTMLRAKGYKVEQM